MKKIYIAEGVIFTAKSTKQNKLTFENSIEVEVSDSEAAEIEKNPKNFLPNYDKIAKEEKEKKEKQKEKTVS